eukprot:COSAG02_NODE_6699_length_3414_cov_8.770437_2_plen_278_part_00
MGGLRRVVQKVPLIAWWFAGERAARSVVPGGSGPLIIECSLCRIDGGRTVRKTTGRECEPQRQHKLQDRLGDTHTGGCYVQAKRNAVAELLRTPASQLSREDAICFACHDIHYLSSRHELTPSFLAAGFSSFMDYFSMFVKNDPMVSRQKMPGDAVPRRMAALLLELIQSGELPPLLQATSWMVLHKCCLFNRQTIAAELVDSGIFQTSLAELRKLGGPAVSVASACTTLWERPADSLLNHRTCVHTCICPGMAALVAVTCWRWKESWNTRRRTRCS